MTSRTIFLSRLIGLYCILVVSSMLLHRPDSVDLVSALLHNPSMMWVLSVMTPDCWAGDGSGAQCLVGRSDGGGCYPLRLGSTNQRTPLLVSALWVGIGVHPQRAPQSATLTYSGFASKTRRA